MGAEILSVQRLNAGYGGKLILAGIDLTLQSGDVLGLLGANGSGKSTLLKAISGQLTPFSGEVAIAGVNLRQAPERAKAGFGFAVEGADLPGNLTGQQYLELVASIRRARLEWPCKDVIARLGLAAWLDMPIRGYSVGTKAKISIAAALLGAPELLILDESLNGLDPLASWEAKQMIAELASTGRHAVIISTHVVGSVPGLCNRAVFLAEGQVVQCWDTAGLQAQAAIPGGFEADVIQALKAFNAKSPLAA